jgi:hypothetical protein
MQDQLELQSLSLAAHPASGILLNSPEKANPSVSKVFTPLNSIVSQAMFMFEAEPNSYRARKL